MGIVFLLCGCDGLLISSICWCLAAAFMWMFHSLNRSWPVELAAMFLIPPALTTATAWSYPAKLIP